jgi:hypothetical protein
VWPRTPITFFVRPKKVIQETPRLIEAALRGEKSKTEKRVGFAHDVGQSPTYHHKKIVRTAHTKPLCLFP